MLPLQIFNPPLPTLNLTPLRRTLFRIRMCRKAPSTTIAKAMPSRWACTSTKSTASPFPKSSRVSGGVFKLYEKLPNQVTTSSKVSKYESYLVLGFGASGKDLQQKWNITYLGSETLNGIKTDKLELIAKDPSGPQESSEGCRSGLIPTRGVSLKQFFDEGQGQSRTCIYSNIKVNQPLPADAFTFKTDSKTQFINR